MARPVTLLLLLGAAALAGTVAVELRAPRMKLPALTSAPAVTAAGQPAVVRRQGAWVDDALARPLFSATRRPPAAVAAASAAPAAQAKLPRLAGILVDGARRSVIFAAGGSRKPVVVAEGGVIDGFRVDRIEAGSVTVTGLGVHQTIRTTFDANAPRVAPPPVPLAAQPAFTGPPGLDRMPKIVGGGGPLPGTSNLVGIPGLGDH